MITRVVHFFSDGLRLEADYSVPDNHPVGKRLPGIVLCPGFGAQRQHTIPDYAAHFVSAGYAVCALDYRGFGGSDGDQNRLMSLEHARDVRAALTWLSLQPEVDAERLGLWGTSGGAAHVSFVTGNDQRVKCAVAQIGYGDGRRMIMDHKSPEDQRKLLNAIEADRAQRVLSGESAKLRIIDLISDRTTVAYVTEFAKSDPSIIAYLTLESAEAALEYRPIDVVDRIGPRALMVIAGTNDEICPAAACREVFDRATGTKKWIEYPIGHYEIYTPEWIERSAHDALAWFDEHL